MAKGTPRDKLAEVLLEAEASDRSNRSEIEALWQSIGRYVIPRRGVFQEDMSPGIERNRYVLDSTAPRALELFASFLHNLMNNPSLQWLKLRIEGDPEISKERDVRVWLESTEQRMLALFESEATNLYSHLHMVYIDLGAFGTAVLFMEVVGGDLRVRAYHLGDCIIRENEAGFVDTMFRRFHWTPRQIRQRWDKEGLGPAIDKAKGKVANTTIRLMHCTFPTDDRDFGKLLPKKFISKNLPFASVWLNGVDRQVIEIGGFEEFPYMVPRWYKVRGDVYGRSPAMTVLPDIRMVNRMTETILRGAEKLVDPPILLPDGGLVSPIRLFSGGITFSEGNVTPQFLIPPGASRIEVGDALLKQRQEAIREGFFVPFFQSAASGSPVRTATEVLQDRDERNRAVAPMIIRTQAELFHRFILRGYNLMTRAGMFDPPPQSLVDSGARVEVVYLSPLAASQRQAEGLSILRLFESIAPWNDVNPTIFDNFDTDEIATILHSASGAPAKLARTPSKLKKFRDDRAEQKAQERAADLTFEGADALAKLTAAAKQPGKSQNVE